jgi:hypothetical protein
MTVQLNKRNEAKKDWFDNKEHHNLLRHAWSANSSIMKSLDFQHNTEVNLQTRPNEKWFYFKSTRIW